MSLVKRSLLAVLVLFAAACASSSGPRAGTGRNPDVISQAELDQLGAQPVRQAIERLRPRFLSTRGRSSITQTSDVDRIVVYLGTTRMGGPEALEQISTAQVKEIRYLSPTEATQRYGTNHMGGAIILTPK